MLEFNFFFISNYNNLAFLYFNGKKKNKKKRFQDIFLMYICYLIILITAWLTVKNNPYPQGKSDNKVVIVSNWIRGYLIKKLIKL